MGKEQMLQDETLYEDFLSKASGKQWKRIRLQRRAGICTPLFSIYSRRSAGIGEIPDLKLMTDWCRKTGMSIIQLLPMNDVGFDFRPYDAQSTFALEPMYLSPENLNHISAGSWKNEINALRNQFPCGQGAVNYQIKREKMKLLWKMFTASEKRLPKKLDEFIRKNRFWLEDYTLFKVIKEEFPENTWEDWPEPYKHKEPELIGSLKKDKARSLRFYAWLQWQLFEQFRDVKSYAASHGIYLMGDLPFLVSRDSADVWSKQEYFKLDRLSGAPPDAYNPKGQRWGMPPYRWEQIEEHGYDYLIEKVRYAQNFYDMFRIDHVVGVFRIWTIAAGEPPENGGLNGHFDPESEDVWEEHGRKLLSVMMEHADMLPCGEDLGTVPACSYTVLDDYAVPGMDVQRWQRRWEEDGSFLRPEEYRRNAMAVISTHDMPNLPAWWLCEAGAADEHSFEFACREDGLDLSMAEERLCDPSVAGWLHWKEDVQDAEAIPQRLEKQPHEVRAMINLYERCRKERDEFLKLVGLQDQEEYSLKLLIERALRKANETACIFSVQLIQDWLSLGGFFHENPWEARINFPGTLSERNWTFVSPVSLEEMLRLEFNKEIKKINQESRRI